MKKNSCISLVFILLIGLSLKAQTKKWTLEECVRYAVDNNITIKQTQLDSETAAIDRKGAFGSFLPSLNANASHSWNIGLNQDITTGLLRNQTTQFTSAGANVSVDIYKGLQNQNTLRKANLSLVAAKYQLLKMQEDIALNVANAFLQVLFNKENLKVQLDQKAINEKQLSRSEELVKAGSVPRGDLLDIKATVALDNQKVITAENALLISKLSLTQLLQLKDFENFEITDETTAKDENNILSQTPLIIYDKAKETRTVLKIAQTNLEIAEKNVAIAKGGFQPNLRGFYNFNSRVSYADVPDFDASGKLIGTKSPAPFFEQFGNNKGQSFGAQLSIPIFNGFSAKNNVERSKVNLEKSKIVVEQQELDLQRNVYTAFTDAKGGLNAYESSLVALEARQEAYNYAKEKYAVGMMNSFDFNQSQTLLSNAQSDVLRSKYDYIFKIKILEFYFGIPILKN
ncbi:TolC family protein [Flavobacterium cellulosilyticum]|uniref:TolC family protein n=1 Tax=Flavobacterium cellulosilyticum TaxID=2541731 RepID=A0A4V2YZB9_9FLAO|nr:TolC family protein [Flavobacterium cellulosilyticum]TDD96517.1 TolC family protein [Flavobacterium cellulosilyticum]